MNFVSFFLVHWFVFFTVWASIILELFDLYYIFRTKTTNQTTDLLWCLCLNHFSTLSQIVRDLLGLTIAEKRGQAPPFGGFLLTFFGSDLSLTFTSWGKPGSQLKTGGESSSAWEGSELGQFVTFLGWVSATNSTSSGQLVRAGAGSLVAVRWVNGSPVGRDLPPVGAVGWWLVVPLLGRWLALAPDLDRPKGSNRTAFG